MKKYTTLCIVTAAVLLLSGSSVMAEEVLSDEELVRDEGIHQYLPTEEVAEEGEIGTDALESSTTTRYGVSAYTSTQGVSIGQYAGYLDSTYDGTHNTNVGGSAGRNNAYGDYNVYMGHSAGYSHYGYGSANVAIGNNARFYYPGSLNTSLRFYSGFNSNTSQNAQVGAYSGYSAGSYNAAGVLCRSHYRITQCAGWV